MKNKKMKSYRLMRIYFTHPKELYPIHAWEYANLKILQRYQIKIAYTLDSKFNIILYGYDGTMKWKSNDWKDLENIQKVINTMPMVSIHYSSKIKPLDYFCGLPSIPSTQHCFQDETHRTCCLLGGKARQYADQSGNPIGQASEKAFFKYFGFYPDSNTLTPWCTCIGSQVCTFYHQKFKDGTHVKCIYSLKDGLVLNRIEEKYSTLRHPTPGVFFT